MGQQTTGTGHVRGTALRAWLRWEETTFGHERLESALASISPELRDSFDPRKPALGVESKRWYPCSSHNALLDALVGNLSGRELEALTERAVAATMGALGEDDQRELYSKVETVDRFARLLNALWRANYDTGAARMTRKSPTTFEIVITADWKGHHPATCGFNARVVRVLFERMGYRELDVTQTACVSNRDADCRVLVTLRDRSR